MVVMYRTLIKPKPVGNIELTDRDKSLIRAAYTFRFLTTDQAEQLTASSSRDKLNKRLAQLWAHGYLTRPSIQLEVYGYRDKRPTVHALGQRGAEWLTENDKVRFPKGKGWETANKLKSGERLEHRIGVTDTMLHFRASTADLTDLRVIYGDELLSTSPPVARGRKPHRLPTEVTYNDGRRVPRGTDPDYSFALGKVIDGREKRGLFFLEWDNSSENYEKTNPMDSAILQKHRAYTDVHRRKLHTEVYGFNNFRVLFVVNGLDEEKRVRKMQHVYETRIAGECPAGVFLYTTMDQLEARGPLADIWLTADNKTTTLI